MDLKQQGRILYVSMADVSQPNGPGVNEREFLLSLYDQLGDRVHAVLPAPRRTCDEIDHARTTLYYNPRRWNLFGYLWQQFELHRIVKTLTKKKHFDLIVARLLLIPIVFLFQSGREPPFAIKTLGAVQGFARNRGLKGLIAKVLSPINGWMFRRIVSRAIAVDCCTKTHFYEHLKDYDLSEERLTVVENATNVTRFSPGDKATAKASLGLSRFSPILGFVGGSPADRGGLQMLDVASRLVPDYPNLGVIIVGCDKGDVIKRRAIELGLGSQVILPGLIPYESIPSYVNSFDVGFALDRPERVKLTGNSYQKVRQYLACGKPVITFIDEDSEMSRLGLVESVDADDLKELELAARKLLGRDAETRKEHSLRAPQFVRERLSTQRTLKHRLEFWSQRLGMCCEESS